MKIIINQPCGIGDIIFCMTIARRWKEEGHEIYWPVLPQFLEGLKRGYPDIIFMDWRTIKIDYERKDEHDTVIDGTQYRVIPLRWNVEIMNVPYFSCMSSKYSLFGWDFKDWKEKAMWWRDEEQENKLLDFYRSQSLTEGYNVVNRIYGSDMKLSIPLSKINPGNGQFCLPLMGDKNIFSLFDYAKVLENASEIHTVSTSILYLLELLDIQCPIHLYERPTDPGFKQVNYLFTKPYILHDGFNN